MESAFNGTWRVDPERSAVWDAASGGYVADEIGKEVIRMRVEGDIQDYEVEYGADPVVRMGYKCRYDHPEWVPYMVREVRSSSDDVAAEIAAMKRRIKADTGRHERHFEVGRPYGLVRTLFVDERTHYRISKDPDDGSAQSVMMRRLAEDGDSYVATVLDTDGIVFRKRLFVRA